ncbi:MAG TPA: hypothetical protein VIW94_12435 [Acidimicrobiia bacterium]
MPQSEAPGCRDAALASLLLLGVGIAFFASGLGLINQETCSGSCEFLGLALLYTGGPISALIGVVTGSVIVAWPLDVMLWVVLGFWCARIGATRNRSSLMYAISILGIAVVYGLVLSQFVELAV